MKSKIINIIMSFVVLIMLVSCVSYSNGKNIKPIKLNFADMVIKQGKIIKSSETYDDYSKDDILISDISISRSKKWSGQFYSYRTITANISFSETLYMVNGEYAIHEFYLESRPYKISIKIDSFDKTFKPKKIGEELYSNVVFPENMPHAITHFYLQGTKFFLMATMFSGTGAQLMKYPEQNYYIVDENGNVYASFTKHEYTLYNQPDMDKYNLIPVIAIYVLVRDIVVLYSKS